MRVLLTRPSDDSTQLANKLAEHGISSLIEPLLEIVYPRMAAPDLSGVQGILVTSANGIRAFAKLSDGRNLAIWAVGPASAEEARGLGFVHVHHGSGDVAALAALIREQCNSADGALLHVAGTRVAGDLAGSLRDTGYDYRRAVLYEAKTSSVLSAAAQSELQDGLISGVAMFSPRTAETFVRLVESANLGHTADYLTAFCLSAAVAEKISALNWGAVAVADTPHEDSLVSAVLRVAESA